MKLAPFTKKNGCSFNIASRLADIARRYALNQINFDEAQAELSRIEEAYNPATTKESLHELVLRAGLVGQGFIYNGCEEEPQSQLVHAFLSLENQDLFKYRDTAKLKILGKLNHDVFNYLFVNRQKSSFSPKRFVDSKQEINNKIAEYKNNLCKQIVRDLNLADLAGVQFFTRNGAEMEGDQYNYMRLMQHPKVIAFLSNAFNMENLGLPNVLDSIFNPETMQITPQFNTFSAIYILNNFDALLTDNLSFILHTNELAKGAMNNTTYIQEDVNDQVDAYSIDEHEWASMKNYVSNMAKFTMSQIPKVKRVDGNFVPIEGEFLNENDLFILSNIIRQAEREYQLLYPEKRIHLNSNTVQIFRDLITAHRHELPSFIYARQDLINALEAFLYTGDTQNHSISSIYAKEVFTNPNITDFESLIAYEAMQSYSPSYFEFDLEGKMSDVNYGGRYEGGNSLENNLTEFVFNQLLSENNFLNTEVSQAAKILVHQGLNLLDQDASIINKFLSDNISAIKYLSKVLAKGIDDAIKNKKNFVDEKGELDQRQVYSIAKGLVTSILKNATSEKNFDLLLKSTDKSLFASIPSTFNTFKYNYKRVVSERPIVQFPSKTGATIPVYRLGSAITNDTHFFNMYRTQHVDEEGSFLSGLNFLVDNPLIFSEYNDIESIKKSNSTKTSNLANINKLFKDSTAYLLGVGDKSKSISYSDMTPADQIAITLLMQLRGISDLSQLITQPVCYSDKKSIGVKCVNLEALFRDPDNPKKTSTLKSIISISPKTIEVNGKKQFDTDNIDSSIAKFTQLDYKFRRNRIIELVNDILIKWNNLAPEWELNPLTNQELVAAINSYSIETKYIERIAFEYKKLGNKLKELNAAKLEQYINLASKKNIELVDELDYVNAKGTIFYNPSILLEITTCLNTQNFKQASEQSWETYNNSKEFTQCIAAIKTILSDSIFDKQSNLYKLLISSDGSNFKYFEVVWKHDAETGKNYPELTLVLDKNGYPVLYKVMKLLQASTNFIRNNYIDLVSKPHYLDPNKALPALIKNSNISLQQLLEMDRGKRVEAMSKRMVLYPATIQQFIQGKIDGVSREIKVAAILDPKEQTWNFSGNTNDQDIYDGSGFISPFASLMEDASIVGHGIHGTKKTLGTSTSKHNSSLFKWAEFPLSNEKMRFSQGNVHDLFKLFKKMHNEYFGEVDVTKSWANILLNALNIGGQNLYVQDGFSYYRLVSLNKTENANEYTLTRVPVEITNKGMLQEFNASEETKTIKINSIFDLYQTLGGLNSVEFKNGKWVDSENSIKATHKFIIYCGERKTSDISIINQDSIYQPLRNKFISIAVNKSAVKRGIANLNSAKNAWLTDNVPLNTFTVNTQCFGVQLDANHHSDLADVREMSQTISALAALGRTADLAQEAYESIADLVRQSIMSLNKQLKHIQSGNIEQAIRLISEKLVKALSKSDPMASTVSFIDMFAQDIEGELQYLLPLSDEIFYNEFVKEILTNLNKSAIRRRYSGLGGVLNPASNIMQLYKVGSKWMLYPELLRNALNYLQKIPGFVEYFNDKIPANHPNKNWLMVKAYLRAQNAEAELVNLANAELALNDAFLIKTTQYFKTNADLIKNASNKTDALITQYLIYKGFVNKNDSTQADYFGYLLDQSEDNHVTKTFVSTNVNPITTYDVLHEIGLLDTILVNGKEMTLTTDNDFTKFKKILDENSDAQGYLNKNFVVSLLLDKPRDLRPQQIIWVSENNERVNAETIYTTPEAQLQKTVRKSKKIISDKAKLFEVLNREKTINEASCKFS